MDPFSLLGHGKLNDFSWTPSTDIQDGPDPIWGMAGSRFHLDQKIAAKFSNTQVGTLRNCMIQLVRTDPAIADITKWQVGRPVFWSDVNLFKCTTVAASTALFAGIAIGNADAAGDFVYIVTKGDVGGLYAAALTKAVPALNDPVVLSIAANLATLDVLADATGWTNVQTKLEVGRVNEAPVVNEVKRIILTKAIEFYNEGIM